jgi:hypothetical protein
MAFTKLPARYASVVLPFILSILMTCIISLVSTLLAIGFEPAFTMKWLRAWGASWVIAFPALMLVLPVVRRITAAVVEKA